jgi:hypothetical protein
MLRNLKRWWSAATPKPGLQGIEQWAQSKGASCRRVRDNEGFVIDGAHRSVPWRIEWGPSQRPYIAGNEVRFMAELGLHRDIQALVLNRPLMEASEAKVYNEYVEGVQTRVDTQTPTEIRWLVMYSKLSASELRNLGVRFGAVSSVKPWLLKWLSGPLSQALLDAARGLSEADAFVLAIGRGRLSMRLGLAKPTGEALDHWLALFQTALTEAQRVAGEWRDSGMAHASTRPSVWGREEGGSSF